MNKKIFVGGVDLTTKNPKLMSTASCIKARYDSGIINHNMDNTGVIEIYVCSATCTKTNIN